MLLVVLLVLALIDIWQVVIGAGLRVMLAIVPYVSWRRRVPEASSTRLS